MSEVQQDGMTEADLVKPGSTQHLTSHTAHLNFQLKGQGLLLNDSADNDS